MKTNLWIYSTEQSINRTAASLIVFGAEHFYNAKMIKELDVLETLTLQLDNGITSPNNTELNSFIFSYLMDCIAVLIFFENYMKAELIVRNYCVHKIKKQVPEFKELAKRQFKEPVSLTEINSIEKFIVEAENQTIFHRAIAETTIGMKELLGSGKYLENYMFDDETAGFLRSIILFRNKLHFHDAIQFTISIEKVAKLKKLKAFVDMVLTTRITNGQGGFLTHS